MTLPHAIHLASKYKNDADEIQLVTEKLLADRLDLNSVREVAKQRKKERAALELSILADLYASFLDDPDATAAWLDECVQNGEIEKLPSPRIDN